MFNFHKDHKKLIFTAVSVFIFLSILIAVVPAYQMQENVAPLPMQMEMTEYELKGLNVFVSENCMACHTQQVRNIEMDKTWGSRPSIPSDYFYSKQRLDFWRQSPSILGSERTGPDLTNIGQRQPGQEWHLLHLYNPRLVIKESIMPGYPWLFYEKDISSISENDIVLPIPSKFLRNNSYKIIASQKALDLVSYLKGLKQIPLTDNSGIDFIPAQKKKTIEASENKKVLDGENLYMKTCASCHQADGKGLPGAFPPLSGSSVVNDDKHELMIKIILKGYDARSEYGQMPGFAEQLSDEEISAIATHERSSWGNNAPAVTPEEVKRIREYVMTIQ